VIAVVTVIITEMSLLMDIYANNNIKAQYISVFNAQLTKTTISKKSIKILRFFGA